MVSRQQIQESLHNRVNDYLRGNPIGYAVEEPKEESVEAIFGLLQRAEKELDVAQNRVARLKWELAKAQS